MKNNAQIFIETIVLVNGEAYQTALADKLSEIEPLDAERARIRTAPEMKQ